MRLPMHIAMGLIMVGLLIGCSDGRHGRFAFVVDSDGEMRRQTPERMRARDERLLAEMLAERFTLAAPPQVTISPEPTFINDDHGGAWRYDQVAATIATTAPADQHQAMQEQAHVFLRDRRSRIGIPIAVQIAAAPDAPEPAAQPSAPTVQPPAETTAEQAPVSEQAAPTGKTTPAPAPAGAGERRYSIQAGDSLALISEVFYGSAEHWRHILKANPGLSPAQLQAGETIIIPALPEDRQ